MVGINVVVLCCCPDTDFVGIVVVVMESPGSPVGPVADVDPPVSESLSALDFWSSFDDPAPSFALSRSSITTLPLESSFGSLGEAVVVVASVVEIAAGDVVVIDVVVALPIEGEVLVGGDFVCGAAVVVVVATSGSITSIGAVDMDGSCARWPTIIILISTSIGTVMAVSLSRVPRLVSNPMPIGMLPLVIGCLSLSNSLSICMSSAPLVLAVGSLSVRLRVESASVAPVIGADAIEPRPAFGNRSMSMSCAGLDPICSPPPTLLPTGVEPPAGVDIIIVPAA